MNHGDEFAILLVFWVIIIFLVALWLYYLYVA